MNSQDKINYFLHCDLILCLQTNKAFIHSGNSVRLHAMVHALCQVMELSSGRLSHVSLQLLPFVHDFV